MRCPRRNASTCASACGCERARRIWSKRVPGSASRQWLTRTTASPTTRASACARSRSYTSTTAPACVFSTGTTAARTAPCWSDAKTSSNVRCATSSSSGNRFTAAISEYAPGAPWYATFTLFPERDGFGRRHASRLGGDRDEDAVVELARLGAVAHRHVVRAVEGRAVELDAELVEAGLEAVTARELRDDDAPGRPPDALRRHDLVVERVLEDPVLMDARRVRERVRAD